MHHMHLTEPTSEQLARAARAPHMFSNYCFTLVQGARMKWRKAENSESCHELPSPRAFLSLSRLLGK
jgi:hypothetical protein